MIFKLLKTGTPLLVLSMVHANVVAHPACKPGFRNLNEFPASTSPVPAPFGLKGLELDDRLTADSFISWVEGSGGAVERTYGGWDLLARWDQDVGFTLFGKPLAEAVFKSFSGSESKLSCGSNQSSEATESISTKLIISFLEPLTADEEQELRAAIRAKAEPTLKKIGNPELAEFRPPAEINISGPFQGTGGEHMPHPEGAMLSQQFDFQLNSSGVSVIYQHSKKAKPPKSSRTVDFSDF